MAKKLTPILLLSSALLLSSCTQGGGQNSGDTTSSDGQTTSSEVIANKVLLYMNTSSTDASVYKELSPNGAGFVEEPLEPVSANRVFQGWFTEREGGNPFYFNAAAPSALYAHWTLLADMTDAEIVKEYQDKVQRYCPLVGHVQADIETQLWYANASDRIFTGKSHLEANRYTDITILKNYSPDYYASDDDLTEEQKKAGHTAEELNAQNLWSTEQDTLDESNIFYQVITYNTSNPSYESANTDYKVVTALTQDKPDTALNIDFSSYFMGYINQLYGYLKAGKKMQRLSGLSTEYVGDYYYISEIDPSKLDSSQLGQTFAYAYMVNNQTSSGYTVGYEYVVSGGMAFSNGKIVHCQVEKVIGYYVDGEMQMMVTTENTFDFDPVDKYEEYSGTRLNPDDYPLESD